MPRFMPEVTFLDDLLAAKGHRSRFAFGGDAGHRGMWINRPGRMIDVYPTLLDRAGRAEGPVAAGLGRSLLSAAPTLVEEMGIPALDATTVSDAQLSHRLWGPAGRLAERPVTA
jgi:hypothetical protein